MNPSARPLSHVSVVDLTTVRSGPTCTKILADFGARVLRVERPGGESRERVFYDAADLHRNKRSIAVNLQDPRGVAVLKDLAARADVVVENYRPDVKHRLGIDYEALSGRNPGLIYASISGFGQDGPYRDRPGYDQIVQGMSGLMWLTGTEESAPLRVGIPIGDLLAGYFCAMGILLALVERQRSGRGQRVETSLLEALVGSLSFQAAKFVNTGEVPPPVGNHHPLTAPMGVYRAQDGYFNIAIGNDDMWRRFCKAAGRPDLADDPRFAGMGARVRHRADLDAALAEIFADPQIRLANLAREVENAEWGRHKVLALPLTLSRTPAAVERGAPMAGEHTRETLRDLGYEPAAIDALVADGIVQQHPGGAA